MSAVSQKRKRAPSEKPALSSHRSKKNKVSAPSAAARGNARLDDLAWARVAIPDDLDDYEGIFGLEEVSDVEVVKDPATNIVMYRAANGRANGESSCAPEEDGKDDGEEWEGCCSAADDSEAGSTGDEDRGSGNGKLSGIDVASFGEIPFGGLEDEALDDNDDDGDEDVSAWHSIGLSQETLSSLAKLKFAKPTPIQAAAIPEIMDGHDVIGKASTGSGKTLAFGIPLLERYLESPRPESEPGSKGVKEHVPLALVLSPTRELAHQLGAHLTALCCTGKFDGPSIATVTGGLSVHKQQRLLADADIVIGTPGRLWELMSSGHGLVDKLKKVQFLVVDEADRLLSQGHYKELDDIVTALDRTDDTDKHKEKRAAKQTRQTLVFSATFRKGLQQKLAGRGKPGGDLMNQRESMEYLLQKLNFRDDKPKFIDVNPKSQMATGLREGLLECAGTEKDLYLYFLLLLHPTKHTLVFTNSISAVRRLTPLLANLNLPALALHSQMPQKARLRAVERFTASKASILVATDVAARGLDIPRVELVVHYHVPRAADAYVHRSGRTARAGLEGSSVLLSGPEEVNEVRRLVAKVHAKVRGGGGGRALKSLDVDRKVVARLKPRLLIAKRIADVGIAKEKKSSGDALMRQAAEDLGVEYDSEELDRQDGKGKRGRGSGRKKREREQREVSKDEIKAMRAELRSLLATRVNVGVSESYLTGGSVDIDALLRGERGEFLGGVGGLDFEI